MEAERIAKDEEKTRQMDHRRQVNMRSGAQRGVADVSQQFDNSDDSLFKPQKPLEDYEKLFAQNTEFFSTYNPDMIEEAILVNLRQQGVEPYKKCKDKYKLKFTMSTNDQSGTVNKVDIQIRILNVENKSVGVEFMRLDGDK